MQLLVRLRRAFGSQYRIDSDPRVEVRDVPGSEGTVVTTGCPHGAAHNAPVRRIPTHNVKTVIVGRCPKRPFAERRTIGSIEGDYLSHLITGQKYLAVRD